MTPANLPWKGVKRLTTSGNRVNYDSWVKMYNLCRLFKTGILTVLTVTSGLGDIYIKCDDSCCVKILTLIMRLWDLYNLLAILVEFDMDSLAISPILQEEC